MHARLLVVSLMLLVGCKSTARSQGASQMSIPDSGNLHGIVLGFSGDYGFTGPASAIARQQPSAPAVQPEGKIEVLDDGRVVFSVNFHRAARGGSFIEPGVVVVFTPGGPARVETYTVSSSGFFGGSSSEERQIETVDSIQDSGAGKLPVLVSRTTMSSRPYTWFNKKPWKEYKTRIIRIELDRDMLRFEEKAKDALGEEESVLNFKRR